MFKVIGVAVVLAFTGGVSFAQDVAAPAADGAVVDPAGVVADPATVAAIDPNAPLPTDANVVSQCTTMASDLSLADTSQGVCIGAANGYIASLAALPALPAGATSERDAALNAMVGKIAQLTQDNICDKRDDELAAAVDAAAAAADAEDTRATLTEVARTIREVCADGTTAALTDGSPADANLL